MKQLRIRPPCKVYSVKAQLRNALLRNIFGHVHYRCVIKAHFFAYVLKIAFYRRSYYAKVTYYARVFISIEQIVYFLLGRLVLIRKNVFGHAYKIGYLGYNFICAVFILLFIRLRRFINHAAVVRNIIIFIHILIFRKCKTFRHVQSFKDTIG